MPTAACLYTSHSWPLCMICAPPQKALCLQRASSSTASAHCQLSIATCQQAQRYVWYLEKGKEKTTTPFVIHLMRSQECYTGLPRDWYLDVTCRKQHACLGADALSVVVMPQAVTSCNYSQYCHHSAALSHAL